MDCLASFLVLSTLISKNVSATNRNLHLTIMRIGQTSRKPFHSEKVDRLVSCVYKCTLVEVCQSAIFIKSSMTCEMYVEIEDIQVQRNSGNLLATVRKEARQSRTTSTSTALSHYQSSEKSTSSSNVPIKTTNEKDTSSTKPLYQRPKDSETPESTSPSITGPRTSNTTFKNTLNDLIIATSGATKAPDNVNTKSSPLNTASIQPIEKYYLKLTKKRISWVDARKACNEAGGHLVLINSPESQKEAQKIVEESGLGTVAIGLYFDKLRWLYIDFKPVSYTYWAPGQPTLFGFFGAMSRQDGYMWIGLTHKADGYICSNLLFLK